MIFKNFLILSDIKKFLDVQESPLIFFYYYQYRLGHKNYLSWASLHLVKYKIQLSGIKVGLQ